MELLNKWINALIKPAVTFKEERKNADYIEGIKQVGLAGLIVGFFIGLTLALEWNVAAFRGAGAEVFLALSPRVKFVSTLIMVPIMSIIRWLVLGVVIYIFAKLFRGKGDFKTQVYLMALYVAPITLLSGILGLIPVAGLVLSALVSIYALYPLTMALKEAHDFNMMKAVLCWIIPLIILLIIAIPILKVLPETLGTIC